ncbi:MAG: hypothetical protein HC913_10975 [Microscillaceae bacterium]|nr:hypothetical protein [Microscillaceae bacterium]
MVAKTSLALLWALLWAQYCLAQADTLAPFSLREVEVVGQIPEAFLAGSKVQN